MTRSTPAAPVAEAEPAESFDDAEETIARLQRAAARVLAQAKRLERAGDERNVAELVRNAEEVVRLARSL